MAKKDNFFTKSENSDHSGFNWQNWEDNRFGEGETKIILRGKTKSPASTINDSGSYNLFESYEDLLKQNDL